MVGRKNAKRNVTVEFSIGLMEEIGFFKHLSLLSNEKGKSGKKCENQSRQRTENVCRIEKVYIFS